MHRPLHVAERLPVANVLRIDGKSTGALVSGVEVLARSEAPDRPAAAEPPGADTQPAEIHHRIAKLGQFPIEHAADAIFIDDQIAHPEVAVHDALARLPRQMIGEPAKGEFERRQMEIVRVGYPLKCREM